MIIVNKVFSVFVLKAVESAFDLAPLRSTVAKHSTQPLSEDAELCGGWMSALVRVSIRCGCTPAAIKGW
jgi:hypothetical protein